MTVNVDPQALIPILPGIYNTIYAMRRYLDKFPQNIDLNTLYPLLCTQILNKLISLHKKGIPVEESFKNIARIIGIIDILKSLILHFPRDLKLLSGLVPKPKPQKDIRHIAIFYPTLSHGGIETIIQSLCKIFAGSVYHITLLTENKSDNDLEFPDGVTISYISPIGNDRDSLIKRLQSLEMHIKNSNIDVLLHACTSAPYIIYDLILFHSYDIPVIFSHHGNFALSFMNEFASYYYDREEIFRKACAVTCLSVAEELYLRLHGVNSIYVPNPILPVKRKDLQEVPQRIAVLGRFGDTIKQAGEALKVLKTVIRTAPWVTMYLIGDFVTEKQRDEYFQLIRELQIEDNITLTGWTNNPNHYLAQCGVLLSVSSWEAFPMNIAEAQALGLPCVIYDLHIEQAKDNPSIISVPQLDHEAAAGKIISLLSDFTTWKILSKKAKENCLKYTPERFASSIKHIINNCCQLIQERKYSINDYKTIIKYASFYSGRDFSKTWHCIN